MMFKILKRSLRTLVLSVLLLSVLSIAPQAVLAEKTYTVPPEERGTTIAAPAPTTEAPTVSSPVDAAKDLTEEAKDAAKEQAKAAKKATKEAEKKVKAEAKKAKEAAKAEAKRLKEAAKTAVGADE